MIDCGPFRIAPRGETILVENEHSPAAQRNAKSEVEIFDIHGPEGLFLSLGFHTLHTKEWIGFDDTLVRSREAKGSKAFQHLGSGRKRMMVERLDSERYCCTLRIAFFEPDDPDQWLKWKTPTMAELNRASKLDVRKELLDIGANRVGTKSKLYHERGRTRNHISVEFSRERIIVPIMAFVITRVLPIFYCYVPE